MESIPNSIKNLKNLTNLTLSNLQLKKFSIDAFPLDIIKELHSLDWFDLSGNFEISKEKEIELKEKIRHFKYYFIDDN